MSHQEYKHAKERGGIVYVHGTINGKRYRLSTEKQANATNLKWVENNWRKVLEGLIAQQSETESSECVTVEEYGYKSLASHKREELTVREYNGIFENYILDHITKKDGVEKRTVLFRNIPIDKITPMDLRTWQTRLLNQGLSGSRVHNIRTVFRGIFKDAVADKIISENPFDKVEGVSKGEPEINPFTMKEVKEIIANAEGFFKVMVTVAFFTGMRTGELIALEWGDINFIEKKISIRRARRSGITKKPKTKNSIRQIDMLPVVEQALREQYKQTGLRGRDVFVSQRDEGFSNAGTLTQNYWHPLLKRCLLDSRDFYNTRHTFATIMISNNEDILWVSKMMGHKDSSITLQKYAKYREDKSVRRAAFVDDAFGTNSGTKLAHGENESSFVISEKVG
ncbi:MAG: tyrosine-type recombinase/integrase [Campylobacterota bacterium]